MGERKGKQYTCPPPLTVSAAFCVVFLDSAGCTALIALSTLPLRLSVIDSPVVSARLKNRHQQERVGAGMMRAGVGRDEHGDGGHDVLCESGLTAEATLSVRSWRPACDMMCSFCGICKRVSGKLSDVRGSIRVKRVKRRMGLGSSCGTRV